MWTGLLKMSYRVFCGGSPRLVGFGASSEAIRLFGIPTPRRAARFENGEPCRILQAPLEPEAWRRLGLACSRLSMRFSATATLSWLPQRQHQDAAVSFHLVRSPASYGSVGHNSRPCKACVGVQRSNSELTKPRCPVCVAASVRAELEPSHCMAGNDCAWSAEALRGVRCRP